MTSLKIHVENKGTCRKPETVKNDQVDLRKDQIDILEMQNVIEYSKTLA